MGWFERKKTLVPEWVKMREESIKSFQKMIDDYKSDNDIIKMAEQLKANSYSSSSLPQTIYIVYCTEYGVVLYSCEEFYEDYKLKYYITLGTKGHSISFHDFGIAPVKDNSKRAALSMAFAELIRDEIKLTQHIDNISLSGVIWKSADIDASQLWFEALGEWNYAGNYTNYISTWEINDDHRGYAAKLMFKNPTPKPKLRQL